jgi:hypothetical protein
VTGAADAIGRSVYLGTGRERWVPAAYGDVVTAAADGLLDENHYVELKQEIPLGRGNNRELARDLAALAVDGGVLAVGIADADGAAGMVVDVDLGGLADRIDQVARTAVDPPLSVLCRILPNPAAADRGVLLVEVPASAEAPHMVDGRYWGRTDRGKYPLPDAEVRRLLAAQAGRAVAAAELLDRFVAASPIMAGNPQGSLFLMAVPLTARPDAAAEVLFGDGAVARLTALRDRAQAEVPDGNAFEPTLRAATEYEPAVDGAALLTRRDGREPYWPGFLDLQLGENGSVQLACGRGTDEVGQDPYRRKVILAGLVINLTRATLALAAALVDETGYIGSWDLGLALTRLDGAVELEMSRRIMGFPRPYPGHEYRRTTTATTAELTDAPAAVSARLVRPLLRALDATAVHQHRLTDPGLDVDAD